jgi:phosphoglycolate phosphatase
MFSNEKLVILDADGTTIDAFSAIAKTFGRHGMDIGDLERFQKRHNLFKYLGGAKEFPLNLKQQLTTTKRSKLIGTLTEVYREEALLYPGMRELIGRLVADPGIRLGVVTRNITHHPEETLRRLFVREGIDAGEFDFLLHLPLKENKAGSFEWVRTKYRVNPACCYVCGDEHKDYRAAVATGMHPFIGSYGFEDHARLARKYEVPEAVISDTPEALARRLRNALGL